LPVDEMSASSALMAPDEHLRVSGRPELIRELADLLDQRRHGAPPIEASGLLSTATAGMRRRPRAHALRSRAQLLRLADGGTVRLVWRHVGAPVGCVLVLPGLNNSSNWPFMQITMAALCRRGLTACLLDYRGVDLPLTSARVYGADSWRDLPEVLAAVRAEVGQRPLFAVGFSMGGSNLLKFLSSVREASPFVAAATVSAPFLIARHMAKLESSVGHRLINAATATMAKANIFKLGLLDSASRAHMRRIDWAGLARARTLRQLEAASICRLNGYADPEEYYAANTADVQALTHTPLLVVHALDDPLIGAAELPLDTLRALPNVLLVLSRSGGHLGYTGPGRGGTAGWACAPSWADELCARFLSVHCPGMARAVPRAMAATPSVSEAGAVVASRSEESFPQACAIPARSRL
jgi:predicted alpha/beta-fold hydrolase